MVEPRLAIVIPAFREAATIGRVVAAAVPYGAVIVVDDCSPDETGPAAEAAGAVVIRNESNSGYDRTLSRGLQEASRRGFVWAVTMDADGEHDPALLARFRTALVDEGHALVLGRRPRKQRAAEVVMGWYFRARYGVHDILCGMKGYRLADFERSGPLDLGDSIGTGLAARGLRDGLGFTQIPVSGTPRQDAPRFDRLFRANMRIISALAHCVRSDLRGSR